MRTYIVAVVISLVVSGFVGGWLATGGEIGSIWPFFVSPGLLACAVTSDMLAKPPAYQTVVLFVALNVVWYFLLALLARGLRWTIRRGSGFVSS